MLNISQKKEQVKRLSQEFSESEISILVDYKGLDVLKMTDLRLRLRNEGVRIEVVKNTLLKRASEGTDAALMKDFYKGPNAIVLSQDDPVAPARILVDFAKDNDKLEIKAGALAGKLLNSEEIKQLAKMPSREELLGKLVYTLNAVPTSIVNVLSAVPRSFVNVLNAIKDQKEAA
ncbi:MULTISPECIES: 50S ribosomal protein L10 [Desulfobacula]|uniref:Large ribosomal subunit protein uL10 n=2 Tax=Desulfobacula TaxID=28222 RepID=K0NRR9_DESTT|nr:MULTISPECIES: 50S ribosomal protein L10 [Desulfobacula]CCK81647.1 RplJ: 50S ribosomal protein L10 [Desulfobacula toluolica Tol2]SDU65042.1 large subunit ribosomal protein L10 [Desulfobacula phenolica]